MSHVIGYEPAHNTTLFEQTVGGALKGYYPQMYSPVLKEKLHDNTIITRLTNRQFEGKFKNRGDTIIIRKTPGITINEYKDGGTVTYEDPEADTDKYVIDRAKYYAFRIKDIEKSLSDINNFAETWTNEGSKALADSIETEFFTTAATWADTHNAGPTAGAKSGGYNLGTAEKPLYVYKTPADAAAATPDTTGSGKAAIVDAIANAGGCLAEQTGGKNGRPWIVIPVCAAVRIQTSEFKAADIDGTGRSMLREGVEKIGNFAGFDVYQSNFLPYSSTTHAFTCLFGDTGAITYCDEISKSEMMRSETTFATLHRSLLVYDFFPIWKEHIGTMVIKMG